MKYAITATFVTFSLLATTFLGARAEDRPPNQATPNQATSDQAVQNPDTGQVDTGQVATRKANTGQVNTPILGVDLQPVPDVLRRHLPQLSGNTGLLVTRIQPKSMAARIGLRAGDVLLAVDDKRVRSLKSVQDSMPRESLVIVRRGRVMPMLVADPTFAVGASASSTAGDWTWPSGSGAYASAVSSGNESVSVSNLGNRWTIDMSLPDLVDHPIHLQGTRSEIVATLKSSDLPEEARQRVLDAIR